MTKEELHKKRAELDARRKELAIWRAKLDKDWDTAFIGWMLMYPATLVLGIVAFLIHKYLL